MVSFQVNDMTCGHCASTITKAVAPQELKAEPTAAAAPPSRNRLRLRLWTPQNCAS